MDLIIDTFLYWKITLFVVICCSIHMLFKATLPLLQVADVIIQDGQSYDFSVVMQLVTMLSIKPSDGLKGFICIVGYIRTLPFSLFEAFNFEQYFSLFMFVQRCSIFRYTDPWQMLLVHIPSGYLLLRKILDPCCEYTTKLHFSMVFMINGLSFFVSN